MSDLASLLANFGVPALSRSLGRQLTESLEIIGQSPSATNLAAALAITRGQDALRNTDIRAAALEYLGVGSTVEILNLQHPAAEAKLTDWFLEAAKFSWGDNTKTRAFVAAISDRTGIPADSLLPTPAQQTLAEESVAVSTPLHAYQDRLRRDALATLRSGASRLVAHMPTGSGKTRTTMELLIDLTRQSMSGVGVVVWLAHSEELCEQAVESFKDMWRAKGTHEVSVLRMWGGRQIDHIPEQAFVVTSFQTAYEMLRARTDARAEQFLSLRRACTYLIVDEAHQATAPTYDDVINLLANQNTKIIGLTATPGRHHMGGDATSSDELAEFFHSNRLAIASDTPNESPIPYLQRIGVLSAIDSEILHYDPNLALTDAERRAVESLLDLPNSFLKKLADQKQRTAAILSQIQHVAIEQEHQTIVFATSKDHSDELAMLLQLSGCEARSITSSTPMGARAQSIADYKAGAVRVLVNFGVLTTGFDAPNTTCVLIARPTTSVVLYSQMVGRGIRGPLMGGSERCLIVDVKDNIDGMPDLPSAFSFFDSSWGN